MPLEWAIGNVLNVAGALVVMAFGIFVAFVGGRAGTARTFALFALGFGGAVALRNVGDMAESSPDAASWLYIAGGLLWVLAAVGIVRLGLTFPSPLAIGKRKQLLIIGIGVVLSLAIQVYSLITGLAVFRAGWGVNSTFLSYQLLATWGFVGIFGVLVLFPLRVRTASPPERSQLALMTTALLPYVAYSFGLGLVDNYEPLRIVCVIFTGITFLVSVLWLREAAAGTMPRTARNLVFLGPALALYGLSEAVFFESGLSIGNQFGTSGILRVFAVAVLAYAVVRHRLLGIDVKLRFAISKSTIAAVFIAVFFIASEAAQQFFGERFNSTYIGIGIAGTLVFAVTPLQRAAERLAEKAVPIPVTKAAPDASASKESVAYKAALRAAMRDGSVTRREEKHLADVAWALSINPVQAHQWRDEVEAEGPKARKGVA